jgi:hypothetical protein
VSILLYPVFFVKIYFVFLKDFFQSLFSILTQKTKKARKKNVVLCFSFIVSIVYNPCFFVKINLRYFKGKERFLTPIFVPIFTRPREGCGVYAENIQRMDRWDIGRLDDQPIRNLGTGIYAGNIQRMDRWDMETLGTGDIGRLDDQPIRNLGKISAGFMLAKFFPNGANQDRSRRQDVSQISHTFSRKSYVNKRLFISSFTT